MSMILSPHGNSSLGDISNKWWLFEWGFKSSCSQYNCVLCQLLYLLFLILWSSLCKSGRTTGRRVPGTCVTAPPLPPTSCVTWGHRRSILFPRLQNLGSKIHLIMPIERMVYIWKCLARSLARGYPIKYELPNLISSFAFCFDLW